MDFFAEYVPFLFRPRALSRALGCGARMGPACTQRCKCGSLLGSVARALGGQSREIWQVPRDRFLPSQSLARQWETRISAFLLHRATPEQHSRQERRTLVCVCGPLLCVCVLLCATCGCMRVCECVFVCWNPTFNFLFFFAPLATAAAAAAVRHVCIITPSLKLSSSLLCGSHGTTAIAHQILPFVTATDGASVLCVHVRPMFPMGTNT